MAEGINPYCLKGRIALVTGAGRGIGRAAALALTEAGAEVLAMSRTAAELETLGKDIRGRGGSFTPLVCDVTDMPSIEQKLAPFDRIDILVNNAGTSQPAPFLEITAESLDELLRLNLRSVFILTQLVVKRMRSNGRGVVINLSSQMGHVGAPDRSAYCMTKHGVEGLTKALAVELAPFGIRVCNVAPTFTRTPLVDSLLQDSSVEEDILKRIPLGRLAEPEEIAQAIAYLVSDAAAMITGTSLLIDGGWTAS